MAELTLRKIFTDLLTKNSIVEYRKKQEKKSLFCCFTQNVRVDQFIIKTGFKFTGKSEEWIKLMNENIIDDEIELELNEDCIEQIKFIYELYQKRNEKLSIRITSETFNISVLIGLSMIREIIKEIDFECKHKRV